MSNDSIEGRQPQTKEIMSVLAFDFGTRHIGVAIGQRFTRTARPLNPLKADHGVPQWPQIAKLIQEWKPDALLVGMPLNMDGSDSNMSDRARVFARLLVEKHQLPVLMIDERLTTFAARGQLLQGRNQGREDPRAHGIAAQLIAESFLNEPQFPWPQVN